MIKRWIERLSDPRRLFYGGGGLFLLALLAGLYAMNVDWGGELPRMRGLFFCLQTLSCQITYEDIDELHPKPNINTIKLG